MSNLTLLERYESLKQEIDELKAFSLRFENEMIKPKLQELLELQKSISIAKILEDQATF